MVRKMYPFAGKSILERYWDELDTIIERLATNQESADGLDKGRAENACYFIAIMTDAYKPDILKIRNEAVRRFKERLNGTT